MSLFKKFKQLVKHTLFKELEIKQINKNIEISKDLEVKINTYTYEFIFTEFGENRVNAGGAILSQTSRLEPTLSGIKKFFPKAKITVYSDFDWDIKGINVVKVKSPLEDVNHPRFGYRTSVYYRFYGLLDSKADFACAIDTDMYLVSNNIYSLVTLTEKFGFCVPYNVRQLLNFDMKTSLDTQKITDDSLGNGHSYNQSPMTLWKDDQRGRVYYEACMNTMKEDPSRGSLVMWKAAWRTGVYPYVLPKQYCVCVGDQGCGDEIILHLGHPEISEYYGI